MELLCCKLHEATKMFVMVSYVRKIIVKKSCKYGEYGWFEHLLFMFLYFIGLYGPQCFKKE